MNFIKIQTTPFRGDCHEKINIESLSGQTLFVGIDVHKKTFHVTLRSFDCELRLSVDTGQLVSVEKAFESLQSARYRSGL